MPRKEQSRAESYNPGDRVRAVIKGVNRSAKGPQIVLSRTDPALLIKLFEQEVPEIYDGTVVIRGAVREAGDRAKVAVFSRERDVDPVGACVGMKGTRVQSIIRELRGEKIDIVELSEDPMAFVTKALSPAKTQRVQIVDDREHVMEVVVEDKQLSLAIGKKGQNVRLAAKLTGWRIDIKSEEEKRREVEAQFEGLEAAPADAEEPTAPSADGGGEETEAGAAPLPYELAGVGEKTVRKLVEAGFGSIEAVAAATRRTAVGSAGYRRKDGRQNSGRRARRVAGADIGRAVCRGASRAIHGRTTGVTFGHCPDLQGRGTAGHHQPGSDRAAQARPRHRGQERVEHDRRGRGPSVRRAAGATAQHLSCRAATSSPKRRS